MSSAAIAQPSDDQLDVVQHPSLGTLKFPKAMPPDERNASIIRMMANHHTQDFSSVGHATVDEQGEPSTPQDRAKNSAYDKLPVSAKAKLLFVPGAMDEWSKQFYGGNLDPNGPTSALGKVIEPTLGTMAEGTADVMEGNIAKGGHKIIKSGSLMALPFLVRGLPAAAAAEPAMIARGIAGGYLGGKAAELSTQALGGSQDQQQFAGDVGNIAGGTAASTGLLRALLGSPTKALLGKAAGLSDVVDPEVTGLVSPRLAHLQRLLINAGKVAGKVQPEAAASSSGPIENEAATSQAAPASASAASSPTLPNATYLQPEMRSLLRPKNAPPSTEINKNTNTNAQEYFIQKMRDQMNRQTVTGSAEQDAAVQRMNDYAKSPFDRATASGPVPSGTQYAYRMRDAGETGIMPNQGKTAQASVDPAKVQSYAPGRATAQNHAQEMVRVDLSKLDPSEYSIQPNGYVKFNGPVPESFIEKMGSKAVDDLQPRVPTSDADLQDLLMKSIQRVQAKARSAKAGD